MKREFWAVVLAIGACMILCGVAGAQTDPYADVVKYTLDQPRTAVMAIEAEIRQAKPDQLRVIEARLIAILQNAQATPDAKGWACRQLRQIGSVACIDAVAPLLADKNVSLQARWALQSIPGDKAAAALGAALGKTSGELKAGVIQTIGARRDKAALPALIPLLGESDAEVLEATIFAVGQIGGGEAMAALQSARVPENLVKERQHSVIVSAEIAAREGQTDAAFAALQGVFDKGPDLALRAAALRALTLVNKAKAGPILVAAIQGPEPTMSQAAVRIAFELGGAEAIGPILADFARLPNDTQALALSLAADPSAAGVAMAALKSENEALRLAALGALGRIGDGSAVAPLLQIAANSKGADQGAARKSLRSLRGAGVSEALVAGAKAGDAPTRVEAIAVLAARNVVAQAPLLVGLATDADKSVRTEAVNGLALIGDAKSGAGLLDILAKSADDARGGIENAIAAIALRGEDREASAQAVAAKLASSAPASKCSLLRVLARVPTRASLEALRAATKDADATVQDAGVRGLVEWPDAAAVEDIAGIARETKVQAHKVLALRGLARLARLENLPVEQSIKILQQAMSLSTRPEERKLVLAGLADVKSPAAIDVAASCLADPVLEVEAATAVVRIARSIRATSPDAAAAGIRKVVETCKSPQALAIAQGSRILLGELVNIAPTGKAASLTPLKTDGQSGPPQAMIDGDPKTYFDQQDGQKLYHVQVKFSAAQTICAITITGFEHHKYAPRDFEILCDGKAVKKVQNAQYDDNLLMVALDPVACAAVELKITGSYGNSPAIREWGVYKKK